jgi:hypothetical protein
MNLKMMPNLMSIATNCHQEHSDLVQIQYIRMQHISLLISTMLYSHSLLAHKNSHAYFDFTNSIVSIISESHAHIYEYQKIGMCPGLGHHTEIAETVSPKLQLKLHGD